MKYVAVALILGMGFAHAFTHPSVLDSIGAIVDATVVFFILRRMG